MYTIVILVSAGLASVISIAAAVISFYFSTKPVSFELQSQVDELTMVVSKMMKEARKERMSRVRQGIKGVEDDSQTVPVSHSSQMNLLSGGNADTLDPRAKKALLRARMKGV